MRRRPSLRRPQLRGTRSMVDDFGFYHCDWCNEDLTEYEHKKHEGKCLDCWMDYIKFDDTLTVENATETGKERTEEIEINNFWAFVYDADEIETLCAADFAKMPVEKQKEKILSYACDGYVCDPDEWIEAIENHEKARKKQNETECS
jgi:hypothetical protein